ncbi:MAG: hypothetical protein PHY94_03875 [Candidatus Omnitrophica bacterium]|nr:hypothetical protein [Candidatus Omnitrophota bacterium]
MTAKRKKKNTGIALAEYVVLIAIVVAGVVMVSEYLERLLKGNVAYMSDNYLGTEQETRDLPYNLSGGKQFVDQGGVFNVSGNTTTNKRTQFTQNEYEDGSRSLRLQEYEARKSPGEDALQFKALPDYKFPEANRAAYVPKFISAKQGFVDPPAMGSGGGTGGSGGGTGGSGGGTGSGGTGG